MHACGVPSAPLDKVDERHVVDHRLGVRHDQDRGYATGSRGAARGRERLPVLMPRLAGEDHHVDEAGREQVAAAIDHLGIGRRSRCDARADRRDAAINDEDTARFIEP